MNPQNTDHVVLVTHGKPSGKLRDILSSHYTVTASRDLGADDAFDLGIVDRSALDHLWRKIKRRRDRASGYLPFMLAAGPGESTGCPPEQREVIDAYLRPSAQPFELQAQTDLLLRMRRLSSQCSDSCRALCEGSPAAICVESNGTTRYANAAYKRLTNGSKPAAAAQSLRDVVAAEDRERVSRQIALAQETDEPLRPMEVKIDGADTSVWAKLALWKMRYAGRPALMAILTDVTDQRKAKRALKDSNKKLDDALAELQQAQKQLVDQERHRALNQMASGIAHDFNNALSTIRGFTELLQENPEKQKDERTLRKYLDLIGTAADNAAETVRRMRKFYRPREETELGPVDLNSVVKEAISMTRPRWEKEAQAQAVNIKMVQDLMPIPRAWGNEAELHEMLTNLIFNAVDAIEDEGQIRIATREADGDVLLTVSDDGCGMEESTRQQCLNPFYTTKGEAGTGLGLSTTVGIVNRHEGDIAVESEPGAGTTFRITLKAAPETETVGATDGKPRGKSLQILAAEDDPTQRKVLGEMLDSLGHTVDLAADGEEALQKFDDGWYDVIITDRAMPAIRGEELASMIRSRVPDKPTIMLTGFGDMMNASGERPENIDVVVSKPTSLNKLAEAIGRVTGSRGPETVKSGGR